MEENKEKTALQRFIKWRGLSQAAIARATKLNVPTISRTVSGVHTASARQAILIAGQLGITVEQMYDDEYLESLMSGKVNEDEEQIIKAMAQAYRSLPKERKEAFMSKWYSVLSEVTAATNSSIRSE